ncbi:DNA-J related domain-containing protein [Rheinheimera sp.]|uniref:DNA-J related domain-containing protein n=1 Tax=Rheinheimera sp. TaxID=1869214 RepID=UPI002356BE4E|nr:DNA-J related domain-containing protein [Rheinheimera sp.]
MTMHTSPLTEPVLNLLQHQLLNLVCEPQAVAGQAIEEQYLLKRLGLKLHSDIALSDDMSRFQLHFVLYHLLYRVQQQLLDLQQGYLSVELAKVRLLSVSQAPVSDVHDGRRQYYLNWQNFHHMTEQLLDQHLSAFWQHFAAPQSTRLMLSQAEAETLLQLPAHFNLAQLKKAYRTKALQLHPDRGGDAQQFILLRHAYQQLLELF